MADSPFGSGEIGMGDGSGGGQAPANLQAMFHDMLTARYLVGQVGAQVKMSLGPDGVLTLGEGTTAIKMPYVRV